MKKQINRKIYLLKKQQMKPIEVVQYETGVQLVFEVQDIELDTTATATLFVRKPSGKFVFQEDNISLTGNTVVIDLHNQAITEYGKPFFQIKFKKGEEVISTFSGMLTVEKSLDDSGAEESKTVLAAFEELTDEQIARIEEATRSQIDLMKAEVEAKGETVLATIPDEYTEMYNRVNTLFNSVANAIKGTVSGSVVRVDDVSPVEHHPAVKVHGKNLIAYPHDNTTKTQNGLTFTDNGDGSVTVVGTATEVTYYDLCKFSSRFFTKGARYFNAMNSVATFEGYAIKDCSIQQREEGNSFCHLVITKGQTVNKTYYPQIEKGTTATEYTPYIDPTTVTVRRFGKNLWKTKNVSYPFTQLGITVDYDEKTNVFTFNGTSTSAANVYIVPNDTKLFKAKKGDVLHFRAEVLSGSSTDTDGGKDTTKHIAPLIATSDYGVIFPAQYGKWDFTESVDITKMYFYVYKSGVVFNNLRMRMQLEFDNSTDFELYKEETTTTPNTDGTVAGITSLSPTMTLLTDTEGVTIECEYNKDTGKVIEKLSNSVVALGGVV